MKGLIIATLAASLLGNVSAFAQSDSMVDKMAGKTFTAADGSSMTFLVYRGGMAREIHTANGQTLIETYSLKTGAVSDADGGSAPAGTFRITAAGLSAQYNDGHSEMLASNGAGSVRMMVRDAGGDLTCTAFYPDGHRFSDADRQAALIDVSALDIPQGSMRNGCEPQVTREAHTKAHRHTAQNDETVVARLPE